MNNLRKCWCGNHEFLPFGPQYGECKICGTLVSLDSLPDELLMVKDDETDFYGKQYWLNHQNQDLGFPDIYARARNDLTERNLHWLKTLLKYSLPPARVMELGCSHGSFVALMQQAGYEAAGVEMSQWVVTFGSEIFDIPMHVGPIEKLDIPPKSLDVIALMDVLEHLPDPVSTLRHCTGLLKPDGFFLIQTPKFQEGISYETLENSQGPFLDQLKADEHLYLFSQRSVTECLKQAGIDHIYFEPAIFAAYDMAMVAGKLPLKEHSPEDVELALLAHANRRFVLALLDLRARELTLLKSLQGSEQDRADRIEQVQTLTQMLQESERDRAARLEQVQTLTQMVQESERDRAIRLEQVESLTQMVQESERDRAIRLEQVESLTQMMQESERARLTRLEQVQTLTQMLQESERDRTARMEQVQTLTQMLQESERDRTACMEQVQTLTQMLQESEHDRTARMEQVQTLTQMLQESERDRTARMEQVQTLTDWLQQARGEV